MPREHYRTKQKELILEYMTSHANEHIKVNDIYEYFKKNNVNIGLATIYRYLNLLVDEKIVKKYVLDGNEGACYCYLNDDLELKNEYHLRCSECGGLFHFQSEEITDFAKEMNLKGMNLDFLSTVFLGKCDTCKNHDRKEE